VTLRANGQHPAAGNFRKGRQWPLRALALRSEKVAHLGYLAQARISHLIEALRSGLREVGYMEGQNLHMEYRFEHGQPKALEELAKDLAALKPDLLIAVGTPATLAAKQATSFIPVVMAPAGDPVCTGIVNSLVRPSGNITGITLYSTDPEIKRLEMAKEVLVGIRCVAVLGNARNPQAALNWDDIQPGGHALGIELRGSRRRPSFSLLCDQEGKLRSGCCSLGCGI